MKTQESYSTRRERRQLTQERAVIKQAAKGVKPPGPEAQERRFGQEDGRALAKSLTRRYRGGLPDF